VAGREKRHGGKRRVEKHVEAGEESETQKEKEKEGKSTSIVSVVNPKNDLGETSSKEKRARERKRERERESVKRKRKGKIESRENDVERRGGR